MHRTGHLDGVGRCLAPSPKDRVSYLAGKNAGFITGEIIDIMRRMPPSTLWSHGGMLMD